MYHGVQPGVAWHMGKIMECGGICAVPKGRSMIATMRKDSFDLTPLSPKERCTPLSVAAHTLYEKTRPDRLPGPGGVLVLDGAVYQQLTDKTVRIYGAEFMPTPYQVKLEAVEKLGYRTIFIGGIRDPILIGQIDEFLSQVRALGTARMLCGINMFRCANILRTFFPNSISHLNVNLSSIFMAVMALWDHSNRLLSVVMISES